MRAALVDVSRWQKDVNVKALKAAGFIGIIARCTIGVIYADPYYADTQKKCQDEDMILGAYHVLWGENETPELEAEWFDEHAGEIDLAVEDVELDENNKAGFPSKAEVQDQAYRWFKELEKWRPTVRKTLYTGSWWWKIAHGLLEKEYDLHEAEYTASLPVGGIDPSQAPTEADSYPLTLSAGYEDWAFGQWTSSGKPIGVQSKSLDYDIFNGTEAELRVYLGLSAPPPPTPKILVEIHAPLDKVEVKIVPKS